MAWYLGLVHLSTVVVPSLRHICKNSSPSHAFNVDFDIDVTLSLQLSLVIMKLRWQEIKHTNWCSIWQAYELVIMMNDSVRLRSHQNCCLFLDIKCKSLQIKTILTLPQMQLKLNSLLWTQAHLCNTWSLENLSHSHFHFLSWTAESVIFFLPLIGVAKLPSNSHIVDGSCKSWHLAKFRDWVMLFVKCYRQSMESTNTIHIYGVI